MSAKRSGFVTIMGRPNVGKSTLLNAIAGQKVAATSNKMQTTRNRIRAIYTSDEGQIVFTDTPGVMARANNKLGSYMMSTIRHAVGDGDVICYLVEPSSYIGELDRSMMELLSKQKKPVFLVITKTDTVPKEHILTITASYAAEYEFAEIFPICAPKGEGVEELLCTLFHYLPEGPMYYDPDDVTDISEREIIAEMIREKALHALDKEIPHGLAVVVESMTEEERVRKNKETETITHIEATIICERDSHKSIVIGKGGSMLKKIGTNARYEIERMLGRTVYLHIFVKVRKDWRNNTSYLRDFGYDERTIND